MRLPVVIATGFAVGLLLGMGGPGPGQPGPRHIPGKNVYGSDAGSCYGVGHALDDPNTCPETATECCSLYCSGTPGAYVCCGPNSDYACDADSDCCSDSCGVGTPGFCD